MKFSFASRKIVVLVSIQIVLIIGSVLILTLFESQKTLLGNSINLAGKNGFLIQSVLLETEKYRLGEPFVGNPTLKLGLLNDNILILKSGDDVGDLKVLPLPSELQVFWNELRIEYLDFSATARQISNIKDSGGIISESDILHLENSGQKILEKSNILVDELSKYSETRSQTLIYLQIFLAMVNIGVHIFLVILIINILKKELNEKIKVEKKLVELKRKRTEEVLYEVIPDCVTTFDKNNQLEDCNKQFVDELGFSKDKLIGRSVLDFFVEEERKDASELLQRITKGEQMMENEFHLKRKDGSIFHSLWNATPMFDDNNEYIGFVSTGVDLFEIDKLRDELVKKEKISASLKLKEVREKKLKDLFYEIMPNPVVTFDQNNKVVDCNQYFLDKMGFSKDELMIMYASDFLTEEDEKIYRDVIVPTLKKGESLMDLELHIQKKNGDVFHSIWSHISMRNDNNEYLGFTAIGLDLTEVDKLRDELIKKEKFAVLGQLAANIAHDIRNPLAVLKNSMHFIQKSPNPQTVQREQPRVDRSIDRIVHQVDDVLEYVGFSPLQFTKKSIREILTSSYYSMSITKNIIVNFPDNDIKIECDEKKLERVFVNILLNAVQAIGSDKGSIDVRIRDKDDRIEIEFENSGLGIDEDNFEKIFEPLFTTKMEGTGLGLAGCKNIVNLHGGIISVTSPPTIFRIELPKSQ